MYMTSRQDGDNIEHSVEKNVQLDTLSRSDPGLISMAMLFDMLAKNVQSTSHCRTARQHGRVARQYGQNARHAGICLENFDRVLKIRTFSPA
jgi:hypothetical protein